MIATIDSPWHGGGGDDNGDDAAAKGF